MQITRAEVIPIELKLHQPLRMAGNTQIDRVIAIFVRFETRDGWNAWGCGVAHPHLTGEDPHHAIHVCHECAERVPALHPINIEYSLAELTPLTNKSLAASCAFDLAFHDLLGLVAGLPLYRIFGGYRNRIQTSITIPIAPVEESVEIAEAYAQRGFRILKIKGGVNPEEDVARVKAIRRALPALVLRLDADGGYDVRAALDVARALKGDLEMLEQPTPAHDLDALHQVTQHSPLPILADQSVMGLDSVINLAAKHIVNGVTVKVATCGGMRCARAVDTVARAGRISTMVSCVIEPALLIAAGLSLALSSPNVSYGDLDGNLDLVNDPTMPGFKLEDGWLVASDVPGLGCTVNI